MGEVEELSLEKASAGLIESMEELIAVLRELPGRDRISQNRRYHHCFRAEEAAQFLVEKGAVGSISQAFAECQHLHTQGKLQGVGHCVPPSPGHHYYCVGNVPSEFLPTPPTDSHSSSLLMDHHNSEMINCAHPPCWEDPRVEGLYDVLVIGGGAAGLVSAIMAVMQGSRTALIEGQYMGGDCLVSGCVPSKALLVCSNEIARTKQLSNYGISLRGPPELDFGFIMERMRRLRAEIAHHDSAERISNEFGIDVYLGYAQFTNPHQVQVNSQLLTYSKCVLCTGAQPYIPSITGLEQIHFYTSETIWNLTELPGRMTFLGGGPVACELAQAFARFGSKVSVVTVSGTLLPREEPEAAELLSAVFQSEGVNIYTNSTIVAVTKDTEIAFSVHIAGPYSIVIPCDCLVIATGRTPNVHSFSLEKANITLKSGLLDLNDYLQTSNPDIYAAGDVCGLAQFTHAADAMARLAVSNALHGNTEKYSDLKIPRCIYTDPEIAHIGETCATLGPSIPFQKTVREFQRNDRKLIDGNSAGFVQLLSSGSQLLGATIVGTEAAALLPELTLALTCGLGLKQIARTIHPYPTPGETIKHCAEAALKASMS